ncbi:MAG: phenylalanine--tRNA ligase subunit beta [bacterium]|nr:phenylalanine--tRNA ligase subunit beta [bacterium]
MKVPIGWLADFIDLPTRDPYELERILVSLGHEVEGIEEFGPSFEGVVVGRVEEARPHPDADRIRFCRVDDGTATRDVVCGAWNFEAGAVIAYARAGSRLGTDTDQPLEVGSRKIRGIVSHGMFASARELGLGDDHDGIMVLNDLGAATDDDLGRPLEEVIGLGDVVLDVSITTNRGDCMGIRGLARELAAYWQIPLRDISPSFPTGPENSAFEVSIRDVEACPRFVAHQVDGVRIGPSPLWMQLRLLAIGQRPISNVVDVSNYVMWELGHPIHTFDADTISGRQVIIRRAEEGEKLETLDGVVRPLAAGDIVVTDPSGPIALAGVMGGASTEVCETTTSVLVEAANWHPPSILATSWRLGLRSEASARFERGVDPNLSALATARTVELVALTSGGVPRSRAVDCYPIPRRPWTVDLTARDVSRLLGPNPPFGEALSLLERLGFGLDRDGRSAHVDVPTHRADVTRPADLVEEIARLHGYDRFPDLVRHGTRGGLTPEHMAVRRLREALVGAGLTEAQTLSFIGQDDLDALGLPPQDPRRVTIRVKNPLREEEAILRTTLLPGLMGAMSRNVARGLKSVRLFETGRVFTAGDDPEDPRIPFQPFHLAMVLSGPGVDVFAATGLVDLLARVSGRRLEIRQDSVAGLHPGRGAVVTCGVTDIGTVGELHPAAARKFGLEGRVAVAEMGLGPLVSAGPSWVLEDVSAYPPMVFDLAFVLADTVPAARLLEVVQESAGAHLESLELFDEFRGGSIPAAHRSLAVRLTLRAMDHTISDEEAAPIGRGIAAAVADRLGGVLRGTI